MPGKTTGYGDENGAATLDQAANYWVSIANVLKGQENHVIEDTIMAQAQSRGLGYIGWSWSGNGGGVEYLDLVYSFNPSRLTPWGQRFLNGANGVRQTSRQATIYG